MAHVHTFGSIAPSAAGIIQCVLVSISHRIHIDMTYMHSLGATSCYVTEFVFVSLTQSNGY